MVKRYDMREFDHSIEKYEDGSLVSYDDYASLAERCERLEQLVRAIVRGRSHCFIPTDDLSRPTFNWDERANALIAEMEKTA